MWCDNRQYSSLGKYRVDRIIVRQRPKVEVPRVQDTWAIPGQRDDCSLDQGLQSIEQNTNPARTTKMKCKDYAKTW